MKYFIFLSLLTIFGATSGTFAADGNSFLGELEKIMDSATVGTSTGSLTNSGATEKSTESENVNTQTSSEKPVNIPVLESASPQDISYTKATATSSTLCGLGPIEDISVEIQESFSLIKWPQKPDARGYAIYKKNGVGSFVFLQEVQEPMYKIHLSPGKVTYSEFKVAALCKDEEASPAELSISTRVQTGPTETLVFIVLSLIIGGFFIAKKYRSLR